MKIRYLRLLLAGSLIITTFTATVVFTYTIQQREIERLNRELVEARQEVAVKTNKIFEMYQENGRQK